MQLRLTRVQIRRFRRREKGPRIFEFANIRGHLHQLHIDDQPQWNSEKCNGEGSITTSFSYNQCMPITISIFNHLNGCIQKF